MTKPDLLSAAQAAEELGVSRATFNRMAADGRISVAHEMPGRTGARLFNRSDVDALKASRAVA